MIMPGDIHDACVCGHERLAHCDACAECRCDGFLAEGRAITALREYGNHKLSCALLDPHRRPCDCGWSEIRGRLPETFPGSPAGGLVRHGSGSNDSTVRRLQPDASQKDSPRWLMPNIDLGEFDQAEFERWQVAIRYVLVEYDKADPESGHMAEDKLLAHFVRVVNEGFIGQPREIAGLIMELLLNVDRTRWYA